MSCEMPAFARDGVLRIFRPVSPPKNRCVRSDCILALTCCHPASRIASIFDARNSRNDSALHSRSFVPPPTDREVHERRRARSEYEDRACFACDRDNLRDKLSLNPLHAVYLLDR